jgi:hypothetical protein
MKTDLVSSWMVLSVCLGYGIAAWVVQMFRVVPPRDWLRQRIWFLKAQIASDKWRIGTDGECDLAEVEKGVSKFWLVVPVSRVQAGWRNVHGLEDKRVLELPPELVDEQLETARTRLKTIPGAASASFVKRIDAGLKPHVPPHSHQERAALLREAEIFRHNYNDTNYENIANVLGKAVWLTWLALGIVVALAALFDRESYFLLGAAGGLISRLTRVLRRRPEASDYGAEWSTLILSPAAGALVGWVGVAIGVALANDPFNVLSDHFAKPWDDATAPLGLALAFLFGFSERLFDRLLGVAVSQAGGELPKNIGNAASESGRGAKSA